MSATPPSPENAPNPFASRFIRPGALPFLFPEGAGVGQFLARFDELGGRAEIRGPHGSGKSTLLADLVEGLRSAGRHVETLELHDRQRRLPAGFLARLAAAPAESVVVIDGYEQLGWLARWRVGARCRRSQFGLLVTCHESAGFPLLWETRSTLELAQAVVARLTAGAPAPIRPELVAQAFDARGGDLREMLFELYDFYEQRARR